MKIQSNLNLQLNVSKIFNGSLSEKRHIKCRNHPIAGMPVIQIQ